MSKENNQKSDKHTTQVAAEQIIKNHVAWSMGAGLIPVPFADLLAVTGIQLDMIRQLCHLHDIPFKDTAGKAIVSSLSGSTAARMGAQVVKFIPGIGSVVGGLTMSILSGATTYAIGQVFQSHFKTGGTLLDFDVERLRKMYDDMFEKGKEYAAHVQKEQEAEKSSHKREENISWVSELKTLADLRESGAISKKEFEKLKSKLLEEED